MLPGASRSSILCAVLDVLDASGGVDVLNLFSRETGCSRSNAVALLAHDVALPFAHDRTSAMCLASC